MTEHELYVALREIHTDDPEGAHIQADNLLISFIRILGYEEIARAYEELKDEAGF